jgi:hypothetical protein
MQSKEAVNTFRIVAEISYSISDWEFIQLYNNQTKKARNLKWWKGNGKCRQNIY